MPFFNSRLELVAVATNETATHLTCTLETHLGTTIIKSIPKANIADDSPVKVKGDTGNIVIDLVWAQANGLTTI